MRFIEWESLQVRVSGARLNELAQTMLGPQAEMIERLALRFTPGLLRVEGTIRKFVSVPFTVDIREIVARGTEVRVPLGAASAFGAIPIPQFLFRLVKSRLPQMVRFAEPATLIVDASTLLPEFVDVSLQSIAIVEGGLLVTLGAGGVDLPPSMPLPKL